MNSRTILITICTFFVVGVKSSDRPFFCAKIEENEENAAILFNCLGDNYPEAMLNIVAKCYQEGFGVSGGTWRDFVMATCDPGVTDEQGKKYRDCMKEGTEKALSDAGISEDEAARGGEAGERCVSEKLGRRRRDVSSLGFV